MDPLGYRLFYRVIQCISLNIKLEDSKPWKNTLCTARSAGVRMGFVGSPRIKASLKQPTVGGATSNPTSYPPWVPNRTSHQKMDGWKTIQNDFPFGARPIFRGELLVLGRVAIEQGTLFIAMFDFRGVIWVDRCFWFPASFPGVWREAKICKDQTTDYLHSPIGGFNPSEGYVSNSRVRINHACKKQSWCFKTKTYILFEGSLEV